MKLNKSFALLALSAAVVGITGQSCASDDFQNETQGLLKMKMVVNSEVTRAEVNDQALADSCMIYISSSKGLIHKFKGLENVPSDLWLKSGSYVGEAWTGDSVTASFDKKFYRAYQPFEIHEGVNNVVLTCKIANVVASVNRDRISNEVLPQFSVTVANTRGQLLFDSEHINERGYFMMPDGDTDLVYTISGVNMLGTEFTKTGTIQNVERAHEYVLNLSYNENENQHDVGGAFITVTVDDTELLIEDVITIHGAPKIEGLGTGIDSPLTGSMNTFDDIFLAGTAYGNFRNLNVTFSPQSAFGTSYESYDLVNMSQAASEGLSALGIVWSIEDSKTDAGYKQFRLKIPAVLLNKLPNGSYSVKISATDTGGRTTDKTLAIEVSDASVIPQDVLKSEIRSYSATIRASVVKDDVTNPGMRFRAKGATEWKTAVSTRTRASEIAFHLTGLTPATTYEVQAIADNYVNNKTVEFTTEPIYTIPNAGFEDWSTYGSKNIPFPGTGSATTFWSSGNEGSMSMNKAVTTQASSPVHSGASSIKLASQFVGVGIIGKFAAGNLFAGEYVRTDGTDGVLLWGREMPSCHPMSVSGYANYRPATVEYSSTDLLKKGEMDKGTFYIAITSQKVDIKTKASERTLFDKDADYVLGFGQVIWDSNFGADNQLDHFSVNIDWKKPDYSGQMYIIIVASASLYGDYFTGGNSVMYLDDLSLSFE